MRRVGIGGIWHETNTYSARPTRLDDFGAFELLEGEAILERHAGTGTVVGGMLEAGDFQPVPLLHAGAWPAGRVTADALEELLSRFAEALWGAGRLDGLLLNLHGAMVAEGRDDVEHVLLARAREVVGDVPVVPVLDLHGNPSPEMVALCDALIAYDTYPHVDMRERGREAAELMKEALDRTDLRCLVRKVPLLICPLAQGTEAAPMRDLQQRARALEEQGAIRRVSLLPGFPYSDVARAGFSVVVTYQEGWESAAQEAAAELAAQVEGRREEWQVRRDGPAEAVAQAIRSLERPVVLVDVADNVGGGSPGDGTALLAELLAQGAQGAVVTVADADVAREAARLGEGALVQAKVGAKADRLHGEPVPVHGRVARVTDGGYRTQGSWMTGQEFSMGTTAVITVDGVTVVVMERATPPFHAEQLLSLGVDPAGAAIIVAKGAIAWRAAYGEVAARVIEVDTPGICPVDPYVLERTTEPMRV
ncbi:MAG: M81 family metallopeptidase [Actinomycetota bacterium]|nr:M81 family metallopeptidase [Actinomycetota bacterium]